VRLYPADKPHVPGRTTAIRYGPPSGTTPCRFEMSEGQYYVEFDLRRDGKDADRATKTMIIGSPIGDAKVGYQLRYVADVVMPTDQSQSRQRGRGMEKGSSRSIAPRRSGTGAAVTGDAHSAVSDAEVSSLSVHMGLLIFSKSRR
jgi:hypothetical protein